MRASAYPAGDARASVPRVVRTAIRAEFHSECVIGTAGSSNNSITLCHWRLCGKNVQPGAVMSASVASPSRTSR